MKAMVYVIRFEAELDLGDIDCYLKEIKSSVRLEIGDKIVLSLASFDSSLEADKYYIVELMGDLLERSIHPLGYRASFEISDIMYNHEYYDYDYDYEINFHGVITLKGK